MLSTIFKRFMDKSPVPLMVRSLLERTLNVDKLNAIFKESAVKQYTDVLLFSTVFNLMNLVVFKTYPSINAAYAEEKDDVGVSVTSVYNKLNGVSTKTSAALVRETAKEKAEIINSIGGACKPLLEKYRVLILDGNCIEASHHRLNVLRKTNAGALPGKSLVAYDPALEMVVNVFPCEDGHAQERSILAEILPTVSKNDVWVIDRNFCVRDFLLGIKKKGGFFICREHKGLNWEPCGSIKKIGSTETGTVSEQPIEVIDEDGVRHKFRRIILDLKKKTRDNETQICIITNIPKEDASGIIIAEIYRKRWSIETMFQELEAHLHSEINSLGYPKAALFGFCVALVSYNLLAVVKASLRVEHGEKVIAEDLSGFYLAGNVTRTYDGMIIAIPENEWVEFRTMSKNNFNNFILELGAKINMSKLKKSRRGVKKPAPSRTKYKNHPHVSTDRLLRGIKPNKKKTKNKKKTP